MKKILLTTALTGLFIFAMVQNNYAQDEWAQGKKGIYSVGLGGTNAIALGTGYTFLPSGLSLNVSGEYKVYKFIGVGFQTGLDFFVHPRYYYLGPPYAPYVGPLGSYIGIPIAVKANIHILDAIGGIAIANKLDVYAGLNLGGGPAFGIYSGEGVVGFLQVGPQVGVRYWFNNSIAIFGEFGWGATFANIGVTF